MRKLKVDMEELAFAFENVSPEMEHYLDLETGEVRAIKRDGCPSGGFRSRP